MRCLRIWSALVLLLIATSAAAAQQQQEQLACGSSNDTQVLLALGTAIPVYLWNSTLPVSSWPGLTWNGNRVVALNLSHSGLSGILSSAWMRLPFLRTLDLSSNKLNGSLNLSSPCSTPLMKLQHLNLSRNVLEGPIPEELWKMTSLRELDLSSNKFTGYLPQVINLPSLELLNLGQNGIAGSLPTGFEQLGALRVLNLSANNLTGSIPREIGQLGNLTRLNLSFNKLVGKIPDSLGNCSKLYHIELSTNQLQGTLPSSLGKLLGLGVVSIGDNQLNEIEFGQSGFDSLERLYLVKNNFTGPITPSIGRLKKLKFLVLTQNNFSGSIPTELGGCASLEELWLNSNNLEGSIPRELFGLTNLTYLALGSNRLSGGIPDEFSTLRKLKVIWLELNKLTGGLPQSIGNLSETLLMFGVSSNQLTGPIPAGFGNLHKLIGLDLGSNSFGGPLPEFLMSLRSTQFLFLPNNSFEGPIPQWIGEMESLKALDLSSNRFMGSIPLGLTEMPALKNRSRYEVGDSAAVHANNGLAYKYGYALPTTIDLSSNQLNGTIPEAFGKLQNLQVLNLSSNSLTGDIPKQLGYATDLLKLDLSNNQLSGGIPMTFTNLTFLQLFDVSRNRLSGLVPNKGQFITFPAAYFAGNELCGVPLPNPCPLASGGSPRASLKMRRRKPKVMVPVLMGVCVVVLLSCIFALFLTMARRRQKLFTNGELGLEMSSSQPRNGSNTSYSLLAFSDLKIGAQQLARATNNYSPSNIVGDGGFGVVYKAVLDDGVVVAVKKLCSGGSQGEREFRAELQTLGKIRHPNLVPLLGYCLDGSDRLLVYKYLKNGSLDTWLHCRDADMPALDWATRVRVARGAANGVAYLHRGCAGDAERSAIIHRDIKVSNILLDEDFEAHVADFGLARLVDAGDTHVSTDVAGTIGYIPPEYNHKCVATPKGDVYSFGVVLLEMLTAKRPTDQFFRRRCNNNNGSNNGAASAHLVGWITGMRSCEEILEMMQIACMCCRELPSKRPCMSQVASLLEALERRVAAADGAAADADPDTSVQFKQ